MKVCVSVSLCSQVDSSLRNDVVVLRLLIRVITYHDKIIIIQSLLKAVVVSIDRQIYSYGFA